MLLRSIAENKVRAGLVVFVVALVIRLFYSFTSYQTYLNNDAVGFHNLAVNVARGNGYTANMEPPYEPHFMREPGYPVFLASVYYLHGVFGEPHYINGNTIDVAEYPEITWARVAQSIVGAATFLLFLFLLRLRLKPVPAFVIALLAGMYLPLAAFSALLLRETLQTFLLMALAYAFARFLLAPRWQWLAAFTVLWTVSNLTLQVTALLFVPVFVFCWIWFRSFKRSVGYTTAATVGMLALMAPWMLRTYFFYPDIRVFKSLGSSLTMEARDYGFTQFSLNDAGLVSRDTAYNRLHRNFYDISEREKFERSFSGYYEQETAKGHELLKHAPPGVTLRTPATFGGKVRKFIHYFRNSWIESLWMVELPDGTFDLGPHGVYRSNGQWFLFILSLSGFIFGYAALPGLLLFSRRQLVPILPMFAYFLILIPIIGDEERRGLPMHPFIFMFACFFFYFLYQKFRNRRKLSEVRGDLFLSRTENPAPVREREFSLPVAAVHES
jgi:hypothetical protein